MSGNDDLSITFLGGADEIGASSALVKAGGTNVLVDCGVRFEAGRALPDLAELTGEKLDAILVTHAHSDHTGALPVVHAAFPATPVHMSPPTLDLVRILQKDALHLMNEGWEQEGEVPLYSEAAVKSMLHMTRVVRFAETFPVEEIEVTYLPASHILGASMIHLATPAGSVLFTGDYSVESQRTVPALDRPALRADLVVSESTYGERLHADRKASERRLAAQVAEILGRGGRVLIPAFAIGRAQEVILILRRAIEAGVIPEVPVFVDGMVRAVCETYRDHPNFVTNPLAKRIRKGHPFYTDSIRPVANPAERRTVLEAGPAVIVASSGMLAGGPSAFYAAEMAPVERDAILITGYQDEESPGRKLLDLARGEGPRTLRIGEREVPVRCSFATYGLSAHADRMQMAGLVESLAPFTVVLVHGDGAAKRGLARSLSARDVVLAANGDTLTRTFRSRRRGPPRRRPDVEIGMEQARNLLANAPGGRLRADRVAEAWFGKKPPAILRERLVNRLEELGVVARDDERRGFLRVLSAGNADTEILEELKAENPKGKLIEYLTRAGIEPPVFAPVSVGNATYRVALELTIGAEHFESGPEEAGDPKVAEHLAARALLARIAEKENAVGAEEVNEEEAAVLKAENAKGELIERTSKAGTPPPEFRVRPLPGGDFAGHVVLPLPAGGPLTSRTFRAGTAKTVEQAAARDVLRKLGDLLTAAGADPASPPDAVSKGPDARLSLNRYRQTGQLAEFGYEVLEVRGPPHRPEFVVKAFAVLPGGRRVDSERVVARSRKAAERGAAETLVAQLRSTERP